MPDTTVHVSGTATPPEKRLSKRTQHIGKLGADAVALYIGAADEPVLLSIPKEATLGRYSPNNTTQPTLDLTPHNAYKSGVSRLHATLHRTATNDLMLSDRASGNGTYLNGIRLAPFIAARLVSGDQIKLAQLEIEIYFGAEAGADKSNLAGEGEVFSLHRAESATSALPPDPVALPLNLQNTPPPDNSILAAAAVLSTLTVPTTAAPRVARPTRFQATVTLDPQQIFSQMGQVTEQVIQQLMLHLTEQTIRPQTDKVGDDLELVLKIEAQSAGGFDEATVRRLKAMCEELKFSSASFDNAK